MIFLCSVLPLSTCWVLRSGRAGEIWCPLGTNGGVWRFAVGGFLGFYTLLARIRAGVRLQAEVESKVDRVARVAGMSFLRSVLPLYNCWVSPSGMAGEIWCPLGPNGDV